MLLTASLIGICAIAILYLVNYFKGREKKPN